MLPNIPWNGITCKGILAGFMLAGIVGFLANRILWKSGVTPICAFFKPQRVSQQTSKSPFQVLVGCLGGIATALVVIALLVWMTGASERYLPFLPRLSDMVKLANGEMAGLLLAGCIVLIIALGLKASGKNNNKNNK
jgi:hypothetical protein